MLAPRPPIACFQAGGGPCSARSNAGPSDPDKLSLCSQPTSAPAAPASFITMCSTTTMFGVSASYHRPTWAPAQRALWRRLDHAAIFLLIAGTNTPLALIALEPAQVRKGGGWLVRALFIRRQDCTALLHVVSPFFLGNSGPQPPPSLNPTHPTLSAQSTRLLSLVWSGATAGILQCLFFAHAPKALAAVLYVALGWMALPFVDDFTAVLPSLDVGLIVTGGVIYSLGVSWRRYATGAQPCLAPLLGIAPCAAAQGWGLYSACRRAAAQRGVFCPHQLTACHVSRPLQALIYALKRPNPVPHVSRRLLVQGPHVLLRACFARPGACAMRPQGSCRVLGVPASPLGCAS